MTGYTVGNPRGDRNPYKPTPRDPAGSPAGVKLVKITNPGTGKAQVAEAVVLKVTVPDAEAEDGTLTIGQSVVLEETEKTLLVVNPRNNYLDTSIVYIAFRCGKYWCVDNQAVFQEWMGPPEDEDDEEEE